MAKDNIIRAIDCHPFDVSKSSKEAFKNNWVSELLSFSDNFLSEHSVFHFIANIKDKEDDVPFAQLLHFWNDENKKMAWKWCAGRWVGSAKMKTCTIEVLPRFGNLSLFALLEEIFSINILNHLSEEEKHDRATIVEILLPFIWAQKLGDANKYGTPHTTIDVLHKGVAVKGRLLVRKSILPFFKEKVVVSATREKQVDATICRVILQAYDILRAKIQKLSENAQNAIINFENAKIPKSLVTQKEYDDIQYKAIYESWRGIVDFSWQIIQHHHFSQKESDTQKGFGMFVDMAEIWEMFLRSKLRKAFPDWEVSSPEIATYNETFYKRKIIPDIVMKKGNDVLVFDAKWKRMNFNQYDVDRSDFFQIHTYIQYYKQAGYNVIAGGLLYPISEKEDSLVDNRYSNLFGNPNDSTMFLVDGICFGDEKNTDGGMLDKDTTTWRSDFDKATENFLGRIKRYV